MPVAQTRTYLGRFPCRASSWCWTWQRSLIILYALNGVPIFRDAVRKLAKLQSSNFGDVVEEDKVEPKVEPPALTCVERTASTRPSGAVPCLHIEVRRRSYTNLGLSGQSIGVYLLFGR